MDRFDDDYIFEGSSEDEILDKNDTKYIKGIIEDAVDTFIDDKKLVSKKDIKQIKDILESTIDIINNVLRKVQ